MAKFKIQFVSANEIPGGHLKIDQELRGIKEALRAAKAQVQIPVSPAARLKDVIRALQDEKPDIVHFSAHGNPWSEILLLDDKDQPKALSKDAMEQLFKVLRGNIRLVTLNACYSASQARKIAKFIDCVVGVEETIPDSTASTSYAALLYEGLANGKSVKDAFETSKISILNDRLPPKQQPQLITRKKVDPAKVFLGRTSKEANARKTERKKIVNGSEEQSKSPAPAAPHKKVADPAIAVKQLRFDDAEKRYGIWAESLSLVKIGSEDGSSVLYYELNNLQARTCEIKGIHFAVESTAGLVGAPVRDQRARDLSITWDPDRLAPPQSMDDVIERARTLRGSFLFGQALRPSEGSYTFGWTIKIFNNDALTAWEFNNLYSPKQQSHVDGMRLDGPKEYFARLEWFPVKQLILKLEVPASVPTKPRLRVFRMKGNLQVPKEEVVCEDKLLFLPNTESSWYVQNARWEAALEEEKSESCSLVRDSDRQSTLTIDFPQLGSYYSLDWDLPQPRVEEFLIREAEVVRAGLLKHRLNRIQKNSNAVAEQIAQCLADLHESIWKKYGSNRPEDKLQTSLITYDKRELKLRVVEGRVNEADMEEKSWQFWLPFGLGLAGACFRSGKTFRYLRPLDVGDPEEPENYLPFPGSMEYECLIAFPIDHPKLTAKMAQDSNVPRGRQLVGVMTIGSTFRASQLYHLCRGVAIPAKIKELKELRNDCQKTCDRISGLILNGN